MCMSSTVKVWCSGKHVLQHPVWETYQWLPFSTNVRCSPSHSLALCLYVCLSLSHALSLCLLSFPHFLAASSLFPPTHRCLFLMQNSFNLLYRLLPTHALKWISHYQTNKWLVGFFLQDKKNLHHLPLQCWWSLKTSTYKGSCLNDFHWFHPTKADHIFKNTFKIWTYVRI